MRQIASMSQENLKALVSSPRMEAISGTLASEAISRVTPGTLALACETYTLGRISSVVFRVPDQQKTILVRELRDRVIGWSELEDISEEEEAILDFLDNRFAVEAYLETANADESACYFRLLVSLKNTEERKKAFADLCGWLGPGFDDEEKKVAARDCFVSVVQGLLQVCKAENQHSFYRKKMIGDFFKAFWSEKTAWLAEGLSDEELFQILIPDQLIWKRFQAFSEKREGVLSKLRNVEGLFRVMGETLEGTPEALKDLVQCQVSCRSLLQDSNTVNTLMQDCKELIDYLSVCDKFKAHQTSLNTDFRLKAAQHLDTFFLIDVPDQIKQIEEKLARSRNRFEHAVLERLVSESAMNEVINLSDKELVAVGWILKGASKLAEKWREIATTILQSELQEPLKQARLVALLEEPGFTRHCMDNWHRVLQESSRQAFITAFRVTPSRYLPGVMSRVVRTEPVTKNLVEISMMSDISAAQRLVAINTLFEEQKRGILQDLKAEYWCEVLGCLPDDKLKQFLIVASGVTGEMYEAMTSPERIVEVFDRAAGLEEILLTSTGFQVEYEESLSEVVALESEEDLLFQERGEKVNQLKDQRDQIDDFTFDVRQYWRAVEEYAETLSSYRYFKHHFLPQLSPIRERVEALLKDTPVDRLERNQDYGALEDQITLIDQLLQSLNHYRTEFVNLMGRVDRLKVLDEDLLDGAEEEPDKDLEVFECIERIVEQCPKDQSLQELGMGAFQWLEEAHGITAIRIANSLLPKKSNEELAALTTIEEIRQIVRVSDCIRRVVAGYCTDEELLEQGLDAFEWLEADYEITPAAILNSTISQMSEQELDAITMIQHIKQNI